MSINLETLTITKAHEAIKNGDFSVRNLVDAYLAVIAEKNEQLNVYLHMHDDIDDQVQKAQQMFKDGTATMLTGIPCALKANLMRKGHIASASSKILENYKATYDATVVSHLENQGVIFLGSTNMDEFAMGSSTENSAFGPTKNPHDITRVPGGSSGGSAAAVAADMALFALGTDTGGSIRQPAALCGLVGLKTTYGGVSRYGSIAMGSSLDQIGPFTKTVSDTEIVWDAIKGHDARDMTTLNDSVWEQTDTKDMYTIAVPEAFLDGVHPEIRKAFDASISKLEQAGHTVTHVPIPALAYGLPVYYVVMPAEVSSNLARYDGIRYGNKQEGKDLLDSYIKTKSQGFGAESKRRIMLGTYVLSAGYDDRFYVNALGLREKMKKEIYALHETYDFIATPTTTSPAFKFGEKTDDPLEMYLEDIFTVSANIVGTPAISVPMGTVSVEGKDLPVGIQFMGGHSKDRQVLDMAQKFEKL